MVKRSASNNWKDHARHAVIRVGDGRGFVVTDPLSDCPVIITAAHCLPTLPPSHALSKLQERTYPDILGRLGLKPTVWAECRFADPVADVAVLGGPDGQVLWKQSDAYDKLAYDEKVEPFVIGEVPRSRLTLATPQPQWSRAWLLSLDKQWFPCEVSRTHRSLMIQNASNGIRGGMSGSPVLDDDGHAVGVVCVSGGLAAQELHTEAFGNPHLASALPGWLLQPRIGQVSGRSPLD